MSLRFQALYFIEASIIALISMAEMYSLQLKVSLLPLLTLSQVWLNVQTLLGKNDLANKRAGIKAEHGQAHPGACITSQHDGCQAQLQPYDEMSGKLKWGNKSDLEVQTWLT